MVGKVALAVPELYRVTGYLLHHAQGGKLIFLRGMEAGKKSLSANRHWDMDI